MMSWLQKKQREKCQGRQLEEIEGDSVNGDGHLSSPKTETKARAAAFKEEEMRRVTKAAGYLEVGLFGFEVSSSSTLSNSSDSNGNRADALMEFM